MITDTEAEYQSYALTGELLGVFCEYLWENWPCYNGITLITLYCFFIDRSMLWEYSENIKSQSSYQLYNFHNIGCNHYHFGMEIVPREKVCHKQYSLLYLNKYAHIETINDLGSIFNIKALKFYIQM